MLRSEVILPPTNTNPSVNQNTSFIQTGPQSLMMVCSMLTRCCVGPVIYACTLLAAEHVMEASTQPVLTSPMSWCYLSNLRGPYNWCRRRVSGVCVCVCVQTQREWCVCVYRHRVRGVCVCVCRHRVSGVCTDTG